MTALFAFLRDVIEDVLIQYPGLRADCWVVIYADWHYDDLGRRIPDCLIKQAHTTEKAYRDALSWESRG